VPVPASAGAQSGEFFFFLNSEAVIFRAGVGSRTAVIRGGPSERTLLQSWKLPSDIEISVAVQPVVWRSGRVNGR